MPANPFFDPRSGALDVDRVVAEAVPIAKLVALFGAVALVPLFFASVFSSSVGLGWLGALFTLVAQFVLAVGSGVVLLYVVTRALHLAEN